MASIYKITNLENKKFYVGKTVSTLNKRFQLHLSAARRGHKSYLYSAIRKYGESNFQIEVLQECQKEQTSELERHWITILQPEYNLTPGGDGWPIGKKHDPSTIKRLSELNTGSLNPAYGKGERQQGSKNHRFGKFGLANPITKVYEVTDPSGNVFVEIGLVPFCRKYDLSPGNMSAVANGKFKHSKGWKCKIIKKEELPSQP